MASRRRIEAAREAFGDPDASRQLHATPIAEAGHKSTQTAELDDNLRVAGMATTVGTVAALVLREMLEGMGRGELLTRVTLVFVGSLALIHAAILLWEKKSLRAVEEFERARESWEMENFPDGEVQEMIDLYQAKGYSREQAKRVCDILSRDPKAFVEIMMVEELGILPSPQPGSVWLRTMVFLISMIVGGMGSAVAITAFPLLAQSGWGRLGFSAMIFWLCGALFSRTALESPLVCGSINAALGCGVVYLSKTAIALLF